MADRPFAYVCSPYRGDEEANAERAREYSRQVFEAGYCPITPHIYFSQFLSEAIPAEREAGMEMGAALLSQCRALVVCGNEISEGMVREIRLAEQLHVPVLTLDAFLPETARDRPHAASPELLERIAVARVGRAAAPVPEHKPHGKDGEIGKIHVFVANPNNYGPDGHVDTMLRLPVTEEEFAEALRFIGIGGKYTPQADYYFHSVQTWDDSFRAYMPRKVDDQGFNELNYLAAKLNGLTEPQREVLLAIMESGRHCGDVKDIINLLENVNHFDLLPFSNETEYGEFLIKFGLDDHAEAFSVLEDSDYPEDHALAAYIERMQAHLSPEAVGREVVARENGVFTDYGYLSGGDGFQEVYRGPEDIPTEHRALALPEPDEKGYVIATTDDSGYYLPNVLHIERNDSLVPWEYKDDEKAARGAERDGVKLIYGMSGVDDGVYIDTPDNRRAVEKALRERETGKPSVLEQIAASRSERAAAPEKPAPDKPRKPRGPEL